MGTPCAQDGSFQPRRGRMMPAAGHGGYRASAGIHCPQRHSPGALQQFQTQQGGGDTDTTVWLVTGDPQHPAALSRAMQKQSEKINEVLLCPLALQEQQEEGVRTLPEPQTKASRSPPSPQTPIWSLPGCKPPGRAGRPCQHPAAEPDLGRGPRHDKRLLSRETAGQEKTRAGRM